MTPVTNSLKESITFLLELGYSILPPWLSPLTPILFIVGCFIVSSEKPFLNFNLIKFHTHYFHNNLLLSYRALGKSLQNLCIYLMSISPIRLLRNSKNHTYLVQYPKCKYLISIYHRIALNKYFLNEWTNEPHVTVFLINTAVEIKQGTMKTLDWNHKSDLQNLNEQITHQLSLRNRIFEKLTLVVLHNSQNHCSSPIAHQINQNLWQQGIGTCIFKVSQMILMQKQHWTK